MKTSSFVQQTNKHFIRAALLVARIRASTRTRAVNARAMLAPHARARLTPRARPDASARARSRDPTRRRRHRNHAVVARATENTPNDATRTRRDVLRDAAIASTLLATAGASAFARPLAAVAEEAVENAAPKTPCVLITGANSGVGYTAAKQIAAQGTRTVVVACRSVEKSERAVRELKRDVGEDAKVISLPVGLELTDLRSVREYALAFLDRQSDLALDALVLNAGIMAAPLERTAQGHELHFGINHLGHFLLADALTPMLRETRGRVVSVSSLLSMIGDFALDLDDLDWNKREYDPWYAYGASKAQNVLFADEYARREGKNGIVANSLHPGIVTTNLVRYSVPDLVQSKRDLAKERESFVGKLAAKAGIRNPDEGARTSVWLATSDEAARQTGKFFIDPGLEYPGATREQLVEAGDWFLSSGTEFLAPQLHFPERLFEWRTSVNAAKLWTTSQEMVDEFVIR